MLPSQRNGLLSAGHLSEAPNADDVMKREIVLTTGDH